ncbi:TonB-dependent receptor [Sunxiuqinia sp. sy24]|uniref:TonB-dependent receptor n=1 Tax=Sunxiuqinia sp. sy24 TaxID=3461495 RepID=UPI00404569F0
MKKKLGIWGSLSPFVKSQTGRIMRLSFLFLLAGLMQVSASSYSQNARLNLDFQDAQVREVMQAIESQSKYRFAYSSEFIDISQEVDISLREQTIEQTLKALFDGSDISYSIEDRVILLSARQTRSTIQQAVQITGKVTDSTGQPLPGVTVLIKGTARGTVTDFDGKYSIGDVPGNGALMFSFVGMRTEEIMVDNQSSINLVMVEDAIGLEEVVAVGYGTQKKVNLTGSVATVKAEELANRSTSTTIEALQGAVPGAVVTRGSGLPGQEDFKIQIRGATSINNQPVLVLVDGVSGSLDRVQPEDIESISVLKDAAAAAIYGSRSAGGVILITTKKGAKGKVTVNYNGLYTINKPARMPEPLPMGEIALMQNISRENAGLAANWKPEDIDKINDPNIWYEADPNKPNAWKWFGDNNYVDLMINEDVPQQNHNISVSGGQEKLSYRVSTTYFQKQGLLKYGNDDNQRYSMRMNLGSNINKYIRLETDASFYRNNYEQPSYGNMEGNYSNLYKIYTIRGLYPLYTPLGNITGFASQLTAGTTEVTKDRYQLNSRLYVTDLVKGLKISVVGGLRSDVDRTFSYLKKAPIIGADGSSIIGSDNPNDRVYRSSADVLKKDFQFLVDYDKSFGKHTFHGLAGYSFEEYNYTYWNAQANGLVNDNLYSFDWADISSYKATDNMQSNAFQAVFGRLTYNYDSRYLFEANVRYDGSSKLAKKDRYQIFPSFSLGWRVSQESWFNVPFISEAKVRASWGRLGNGDVLGNYDYIAMLNSSKGLILDGAQSQYIYQGRLASAEKSWETIETSNIGVDLGFFDNKLTMTGDYFVKYNKDMLVNVTYPSVIGVSVPAFNAGELKTWGWEMSATWKQKVKDFTYSVSFNLGDSENELVEYYGKNVIGEGVNKLIEGMPINSIYGYKTDGYFQTPEEVEGHPYQSSVTGVGDVKYVNMNDDDKINAGRQSIEDHGDLVYLGNTSPRYNYGITANAAYKGFDLSIFFQGVGKRNFYVNSMDLMPFAYSWVNPYTIHRDYWTPDNPDAYFPRLYERGFHNFKVSDKWVQNGAYVRLKNVQLGYTIPRNITMRAGIEKLRVYFTGQDLWEKTKTLKIYDPEMPQGSSYRYPFTRGFAFGVNLTF